MVGEDGEVAGGVAVVFVVVGVLVDAPCSSFAVEDAVVGLDGGDVAGADAAVVGDADAAGGDGAAAAGVVDDPFRVFCAEHDDVAA